MTSRTARGGPSSGHAISFKSMPKALLDSLEKIGIDPDDIEVTMQGDLDMEGRSHESWVVITDTQVLGVIPGYASSEGVLGPFDRERVDKVRIFRGVGSNFLQVRVSGVFLDIIRFTNRLREEFDRVRLFMQESREGSGDALKVFSEPNPLLCPSCGLPLPGRGADCPRCAHEGELFARTLSLMKPYTAHVAGLLGLMLCGVTLDLLPPYLTRILVDDVLTGKSRAHLLIWLVLALAGAALLRALLNIGIGRMSTAVGTKVTYNLRSRLHEKLSQLSVDFHDRSSLGNLITRLLHDVDYFHGFVQQMAQGFFVNILLVLGIGIMLFRLNSGLALYVLIPIPFVVVGTWFFWHTIYPRYYRFWDSQSKLAALLNGMLSGIRTVKAFAQEDREHSRFQDAAAATRDSRRAVDQSTATFLPIFGYVFGLGGLIIWYAGGRRVLDGHITLGTMMAFLGYVGMFYGPISALTMFSNWLTGFLTAGQRIFEILDTHSSIREPAEPVTLPGVQGAIEFTNVTFGYDPYQPVLKDINLSIRPGQTVGIVGKSGSGKTTLINLICRFYDPQQGAIHIDNVDVRHMRNAALRRHVGLVLQEPFLFRATIAENLAYGRPDAPPCDIINAACAANCHEFILKQPSGYDTRLGERGAGLSGGERQRISIARAILCDPAILILDEATSNVDTESEQNIQKSLTQLVKGRTTIVIAHRLSTLKTADVIYVLDEGRIIENGTHEQLLECKGHYHNLVMIQTDLSRLEG